MGGWIHKPESDAEWKDWQKLVRPGDMGNTFGPNGFSSGSSTRVSRSKYPRS